MTRYLKIAGAIAILASPIFAVLLGISVGKGCATAPTPGTTAAIVRIHHHVGATTSKADDINTAADNAIADVIAGEPGLAAGYDVEYVGTALDRLSRGM